MMKRRDLYDSADRDRRQNKSLFARIQIQVHKDFMNPNIENDGVLLDLLETNGASEFSSTAHGNEEVTLHELCWSFNLK